MVQYYKGNETGEIPGLLSAPYYWFEAGRMFDALIQYWNLTGDSQYNKIVTQALLFQSGDEDFMPLNQTKQLGNDDQSTWALAALSAAEAQLPDGTESSDPTWLTLAQNVFDQQVARWDTSSCDGGLRWQIFTFNVGYEYKNTFSNGQFFELASRLASFTGNSTYVEWASKVYEWSTEIGFVDEDWNVYDGARATDNCTSVSKLQFSATAGAYISGSAHLYNSTTGSTQEKWKKALDGFLTRSIDVFFPDGVVTEPSCETQNTCSNEMKAYKGVLGHKLIDIIQVAPYTSAKITPLITSSAEAAAKACGDDGCSFYWDGTSASGSGVNEQLSALTYVQGLLVGKDAGPVEGKAGNATTTAGGADASASSTSTPTSSESSTTTPNTGITVRSETTVVGIFAGLWLVMSLLAM